jgi:Arc/MetJ family transcription regulator
MDTNLAINDDLVSEAVRLGGHRTKQEAVDEALREYIAHRQRLAAIEAFGTIDFDPEYDYKRARAGR